MRLHVISAFALCLSLVGARASANDAVVSAPGYTKVHYAPSAAAPVAATLPSGEPWGRMRPTNSTATT